jgi:hypothetical protein
MAGWLPQRTGRARLFGPQHGPAMARIVTYAHRYKRPPRRKKAVALEGPKVVTIRNKRRRASEVAPPASPAPVTPANEASKSAIVTSRRRSQLGEAADLP